MPGELVPQTILSEIGWNDRYAIPVANAENKRLEDELMNLNRQLVQVQNKLAQDEDRVGALTDHMKNVRSELGHTHALYEAQVKAHDTERHLQKVAERELGRLQQELLKLDKDLQEQKEKKNFFENTIFKQTQRMEEKKAQMNWDNQALDAWLKECKRRDDDAMTLAKYTREDDEKIKEITLKLNNLTDDFAKKKRQLDHESMETQTAQVELDKTAEQFRRGHIERQQLLHQWEQTIAQMARRDDEMNILALELENTKVEVRNKENLRKEKLQFFRDAQANNQDSENRINQSEREAAAIKRQYFEAEKQRNELQSNLETLKRTTDRTNSDLEIARADVTLLKQEVTDKLQKLENVKTTVKELKEKLEQTTNAKLSAEEKNAELIRLLQEEEHNVLLVHGELKQMRDGHFVKNQILTDLMSEKKRVEGEIQGTRSGITNLNSRVRETDKEILRQEEMIYHYDLTIQAAKRSVGHMEGEQSNEEIVALEAKIRDLLKTLNERVSTRNLLSGENKRQQDEVRKVKRRVELNVSSKEDLRHKIDELELHIDNAQKVLKKTVNDKQDKMVDKNLLDLRIKKALEELNRQAGEVLSQEKHRLQLETVMKERRLEIDVHSKLLTTQLRDAEEQRRETNIQLQERITRIDKLRKRYENFMILMTSPEDEGGDIKSQAYFIIKAAQEKEELQRIGDELDARIRKAEKEVCALKNTLKVMRSSNEVMRKDQNKIQESGDQVQERYVLEEQHRTLIDKFRHKKRLLRERQEDIQRMIQNRDVMISELDLLAKAVDERQANVLQLTKEVEDQQTKLDRVIKLNAKLLRDIRQVKKVKEADEESDIDLRDLRDLNKRALQQMAELVGKHPELAPSVQIYLEQAGLSLPSTTGLGSRSSSGSLSSFRSSLLRSGRGSSVPTSSSHSSSRSESAKVSLDGVGVTPPRRSSIQGPALIKQFTIFGDDIEVSATASDPSVRAVHSTDTISALRSLERKSHAPERKVSIFTDRRTSTYPDRTSTYQDKRPSTYPDRRTSMFPDRRASSFGGPRGIAQRKSSVRPGSIITGASAMRHESVSNVLPEAFTVFGAEYLDVRASPESPEDIHTVSKEKRDDKKRSQ